MKTIIKVHFGVKEYIELEFTKVKEMETVALDNISELSKSMCDFQKVISSINNIDRLRELIKDDIRAEFENLHKEICDTDELLSGYNIEKWESLTSPKLNFYAFKGTIVEGKNCKMAAVNMCIPTVFLDPLRNGNDKYKYNEYQFLLKPADEEFLNEPTGDHGQHGCPTPPIGGGNGGKKIDFGDCKIPYTQAYFKFNKNYYFPMIMPNWTICYFVTEDHEKNWGFDPTDSKKSKVSVDFPIQYDTTLGIFYTREVSFV